MANQPGTVKRLNAIADADVDANGGYVPGDAEKVNISGLTDLTGGTEEPSQGVSALVRVAGNGGNPRGDGAVDLQQSRDADTQVASGIRSVISGGSRNMASEVWCTISGGGNNTASGYSAVIGGGFRNTASGHYSAVLGGGNNTASGYYSAVFGGSNNTASGYSAVICGGMSNTISGYYSAVLGGWFNTASGHYSAVLGGKNVNVSGDHTHVIGYSDAPVAFAQNDAFVTYGLRAYMHAPNSAPTDADLKNGSISFWLDEIGDTLTFRCKYSDGTLKTGTVALI